MSTTYAFIAANPSPAWKQNVVDEMKIALLVPHQGAQPRSGIATRGLLTLALFFPLHRIEFSPTLCDEIQATSPLAEQRGSDEKTETETGHDVSHTEDTGYQRLEFPVPGF